MSSKPGNTCPACYSQDVWPFGPAMRMFNPDPFEGDWVQQMQCRSCKKVWLDIISLLQQIP